jgi:predicted adenylyl cyclase CyaB
MRSPSEVDGRALVMPRNVEIKAKIRDLPQLRARAQSIADSGPFEIQQDDTFFACHNGRLKLRIFSKSQGELIFYKRDNSPNPKESRYVVTPTSTPYELRETLVLALGECGRVRKQRTLFLAGKTRIHLDEVEGLGAFMELEVVLSDGETVARGIEIAHEIMQQLGVSDRDLVDRAYVDLLQARV